jgi:3-hydroxyacyl-[acyl-carrier protein] dehydratase / trans-2-decenoyl-[acyl-carrier protein] isomerase
MTPPAKRIRPPSRLRRMAERCWMTRHDAGSSLAIRKPISVRSIPNSPSDMQSRFHLSWTVLLYASNVVCCHRLPTACAFIIRKFRVSLERRHLCVNTTFDEDTMTQRRSSYAYEDLLACGRGELFGAGNAQLPLPPLLMLDRITSIRETGGAHGKGQVVADLKIAGNPQLEWIFSCHFTRDPVMPGCFMLDALWQMTGFFLGWLGATGRDRPLGVGEVKLKSMVTPAVERLEYVVDLKKVTLHGPNVAVSDGLLRADDQLVYTAADLRVRLFEAGAHSTWIEGAAEEIRESHKF